MGKRLSTKLIFTVMLISIATLSLVGCKPSPQDYADAQATKARTARQNELHRLDVTDIKATASTRQETKRVLMWGFVAMVLAFFSSSLMGYTYFVLGMTTVKIQASKLQSQLISYDKDTLLLPVRYFEVKGRLFAHNPNTGQIQKLGQACSPDILLTQGSQAVQLQALVSDKGVEVLNSNY